MEPDPIDAPLSFDPQAATEIEQAAFDLSHPNLVLTFVLVSDVSKDMRSVPYVYATVNETTTYHRMEKF